MGRLADERARPARAEDQAPVRGGPQAAAARPVEPLTFREEEILGLLARGLSNQEIARALFLAEGTVKNYISRIYAKLPARDRAQAVLFAIQRGLTEPSG
jgi:DNA-binding NarL/FixJ family response regulator